MNFNDQIEVLKQARGNPAKLALVSIDLSFPQRSEAHRNGLKQALQALAVPHWCNEAILASLLELPEEEAAARLAELSKLNVVEPFPARGGGAVNVHEATRLALRGHVAADDPEGFRVLSGRAKDCFRSDPTASGRIEWIYHSLCSDPDEGAAELQRLAHAWLRTASSEELQALTAALGELKDGGLLESRALVWSEIVITWVEWYRSGPADMVEAANRIIEQARALEDRDAESEGLQILSSAKEAQRKLDEALEASAASLQIALDTAGKAPESQLAQADLATTYVQLGSVYEQRDEFGNARKAFEAALRINVSLAEKSPENAGWQRDLAVAYNRFGGALELQNQLEEALKAFRTGVEINQRLVEQDPDNTGWRRELAASYNRCGDVLRKQGELELALTAHREELAINLALAEQDPSHPRWRSDLAKAYYFVGGVHLLREEPGEALAALQEALTINQQLMIEAPQNMGTYEDLAGINLRIGRVLELQNKPADALAAYEVALAIRRNLDASGDAKSAMAQQFEAFLNERIGALRSGAGNVN